MGSLEKTRPIEAAMPNALADIKICSEAEVRRHSLKLDVEDLGSGKLVVVGPDSTSALSIEELRNLWRRDDRSKRVSTADFDSSNDFVYSEGFSLCQALIMWDPVTSLGAFGHFNPQTDPEYMLEGHTYGPFGGFNKNVPRAQDIFSDPGRVKLAHVFGEAYSFPEVWLNKALERKGFLQPVMHVKINSSWRDVGLDSPTGNVFVLRSDRNYPGVFKLINSPAV